MHKSKQQKNSGSHELTPAVTYHHWCQSSNILKYYHLSNKLTKRRLNYKRHHNVHYI